MLSVLQKLTFRPAHCSRRGTLFCRHAAGQASEQVAEDLWTTGPLLRAVELAPLYSDSKTFVCVFLGRSVVFRGTG